MTLIASYPWEYVKDMSSDDICDILLKGKERMETDRLFFRWCLLEVHNYGEPISFTEYVKKMRYHVEPSVKEIMKQQEIIINQFNQGFQKVAL